MEREEEGTTFAGDLLRDGARSSAAGLGGTIARKEKSNSRTLEELEVRTGAANVRFLSASIL